MCLGSTGRPEIRSRTRFATFAGAGAVAHGSRGSGDDPASCSNRDAYCCHAVINAVPAAPAARPAPTEGSLWAIMSMSFPLPPRLIGK
jgi:hypothetical protein